MKKKKILILLTDAGNGHRSAADALNKVFEREHKDSCEVHTIDLFQTADIQPFSNSDAAHALVSNNRWVETFYNFFFWLFLTNFFYDLFHTYVIALLYRRCEGIILREEPDLVITVHPIVNMVAAQVKKRTGKFKLAVVVTDLLTLMRGWTDENADIIFAPTEEAIELIESRGISRDKIAGPLFPINPNMANFQDKKETLKELGFKKKKPILLITGGGVGTVVLEEAIRKIVSEDIFNLVIIAGRLEALKDELTYKYGNNKSVRILGFVNNMQDYLNVSDIVVGKPGPATILELELFNRKAVLTRRIGMQEDGNITYSLKSKNFVYIGEQWNLLIESIHKLLNSENQNGGDIHNRQFDECSQIIKHSLKLIED